MQIGLIILGLFLIFILWTWIEQKQLVTSRYKVVQQTLPKALHNTSFLVLSDLHERRFGKHNERLVKKIDKLAPTFILIAGDMVNKKMVCYPGNSFSLLEQLAKKYRIYYAYGNHEQRFEKLRKENQAKDQPDVGSTWVEYKKKLSDLKVVFLDNESIIYEKDNCNIKITGVSLDERYFEHGKLFSIENNYLSSLIGNKQEGIYEILIAHNPTYFKSYAKWGADLIISGHLHGGMVRLPFVGGIVSPQVWLFPKYSSGIHKENDHQMIVSRGLGSHSLMPRLFNTPEIVQVTLYKES